MTTVLLSRWIDTFYGIYVSVRFGTFTPLLVHPKSPVLLTKTWPTRNPPFEPEVHLSNLRSLTYLKFENRLRSFRP